MHRSDEIGAHSHVLVVLPRLWLQALQHIGRKALTLLSDDPNAQEEWEVTERAIPTLQDAVERAEAILTFSEDAHPHPQLSLLAETPDSYSLKAQLTRAYRAVLLASPPVRTLQPDQPGRIDNARRYADKDVARIYAAARVVGLKITIERLSAEEIEEEEPHG